MTASSETLFPPPTATSAGVPSARSEQLIWVDALRGFAALWVILYHSRTYLWVGFNEIHAHPEQYSFFDRMLAWISLPMAFGGSAVMLFFVISGFCIHLPYAGGRKPFQLKEYAVRRAFRILPPYVFAVAFTCALEWITFGFGDTVPSPWSRVLRVLLLSQNYQPNAGQLNTDGSLWSLPVECELYVAYLAIRFLLKSNEWNRVLSWVGIVSVLATAVYMSGVPNLENNFLRFWMIWCGGVVLAEWWRSARMPIFTWLSASALLLLFVIAAIAERKGVSNGILGWLWGAAYFFLIWMLFQKLELLTSIAGKSLNLLAWMGNISYSAYLIHAPFFALLSFFWIKFFGMKPGSLLVPIVFSMSVWPLAWLFWRLCEDPFHKISRRLAAAERPPERPHEHDQRGPQPSTSARHPG